MKKSLLVMAFVVMIISGVLWYALENQPENKPTYRLERRPAIELNTIADNLLNSIK